jgi:hypothetical protein
VLGIVETSEMICFAVRWKGEKKTMSWSVYHDGKDAMVAAAHRLLSEVDVVCGFNSKKFDLRHMNR